MTDNMEREPMLELFIFETYQLIDQLEQALLNFEKGNELEDSINEIFRIMHTIKGSAAMMLYDNISTLAHSMEDLFFYLREEKPENVEHSKIIDIVFEGIDFIKAETAKIENGLEPDGSSEELKAKARNYLEQLKESNPSANDSKHESKKGTQENSDQKYYIRSDKNGQILTTNKYEAVIFFEDGCEMENMRAFSVIHDLESIAEIVSYTPQDVLENNESSLVIRNEGFKVVFKTDLGLEEVKKRLSQTVLLKDLQVYLTDDALEGFEINDNEKNSLGTDEDKSTVSSEEKRIELDDNVDQASKENSKKIEDGKTSEENARENGKEQSKNAGKQSVISVNIAKLDRLMDLVGELVIAEAMVTQNPDLKGLVLNNFNKAARQLNKITSELQDIVMSIRMVPLAMTFQKMNRIVRDMCKKLDKSVKLEIIGEDTEVDKNIIERISDPLIHLIRNSIDHGIEKADERVANGKPPTGKLVLEAKNAGGDVWIIVKDDGRGLNKEKILERAKANGLLFKPESELTDREIYSFIFLPGFSTKESVTEFSGRGVGMDIVTKNIEMVGGSVHVDSTPGEGTTFTIRFPLTLAIIDGMIIAVGGNKYTIPTVAILESFRIKNEAIIQDEVGNEMIMVRGECYPVVRLYKRFGVDTGITDLTEGIMIMVEGENKRMCIFADALLGQQQVVVKALPKYIKRVNGVAGCTLLGDGDISLILNVDEII
ncbi:chemotaxis protein CheA [Acetivibrio clariflavus]|uniref:Chemotaxis protein CheA n=1 Tax=Acetivibrio clariflavus (strain DSM 19732 / NBRC 101661 / EBR45) TaxID=720554 RepID=G8LW25_ACECE|nr:chemotaxis protein CheA [Acetivibrio clariflavus]AEV68629.1 chemotaxis protein histidine kinase-like protein [Acetivibrio clariflavus DSM 19732]